MSDYYSETIRRALKLEWCYVPAGEFLMGSGADDADARDNEKPQHRVDVPAFYLGKYPITNEQYQVFVQATAYQKPYHWQNGQIPAGQERHPVRCIFWSDAVAFCRWAAEVCGLPLRLLTEAEWEKGARGEQGARYPWGDEWREGYSHSGKVWGERTAVIGRYAKGVTPYGAYDMIGNVWEWTSTIYRPYPYQADDGREGIAPDQPHVARGGGWWNDPQTSRSAIRYYGVVNLWSVVGIRVGWSAPLDGV